MDAPAQSQNDTPSPVGQADDDRAMIEQITRRLHERLPPEQAGLAAEFTEQYFRNVATEDLAERTPADLYGAALSHLNFARSFAGGAPKLRVYNPRLDEQGWQSTHTVIEIVNDDMPFLVDSITMEVNRQGLTLHLISHPVMRIRRDAEHKMTAVAPSTVVMCRQPRLTMVLTEVPSPSAPIASSRPQVDASTSTLLTGA